MQATIQQDIDKLADPYEYVGLRVEDIDDDHMLDIGQRPQNSRLWVDGDPTEDTLDGTCCIDVRNHTQLDEALESLSCYFGKVVYLIGGYVCQYGQDDNELIIRDPVILSIYKRDDETGPIVSKIK